MQGATALADHKPSMNHVGQVRSPKKLRRRTTISLLEIEGDHLLGCHEVEKDGKAKLTNAKRSSKLDSLTSVDWRISIPWSPLREAPNHRFVHSQRPDTGGEFPTA